MACPTCGVSVLFGGVKDGDKKYCSKNCYEADEINRLSKQIPEEAVVTLIDKIRNAPCPKCDGPGPIDVHRSYSIYSIILFTSYETNEHIVCLKCAKKKQLVNLLSSSLFGWWGVPFGIVVTPIQIVKNIIELFKKPGQNEPTDLMHKRVRQMLATKEFDKT